MLWYKAWHESKTRFLYVMAGMTVLCGLLVFSYGSWGVDPARINYSGFIWQALYFRFFHAAWVFSTLFLALGGLAAERHHGSALFTLSLPASRRRMLSVRAGVGAAEAVAAAVLPSAAISAFSLAIGHTYPVIPGLEFAMLLAAGGIVFFSFGVLLSTLLPGDWAPLAVGIPAIAGLYSLTRHEPGLRWLNPQDLFSGAAHIQPPMWALNGTPPWAAIAASLGIAAILLWVSVILAERLEF